MTEATGTICVSIAAAIVSAIHCHGHYHSILVMLMLMLMMHCRYFRGGRNSASILIVIH